MAERLFYESITEALQVLVTALGGAKKVGPLLWPAKPLDQAAQRVRDCLNDGRPEKFSPDEVVALVRMGRACGCHAVLAFLTQECGYAPPVPVSAEDEKAQLQREFQKSVTDLMALASKLQARGVQL